MDRWVEAIRDIVPREASSVKDLEGVGDDPGVGHKPGVDPEVEDGPIEVAVELLLKFHIDFLFELLFELFFSFLSVVDPPVRA